MFRIALIAAAILVCAPGRLLAQSVTLNGSPNVASAEDFATRAFHDPWDMNERTDFGWFLYGSDQPSSDLTNVMFAGGVFSATSGASPNLFLLETGNPNAARLGKTGFNHPIDANTYRLVAIRMNVSSATSAQFYWNREHLWDNGGAPGGASNVFPVTPGWRTYLVDIPTLGLSSGSVAWNGIVKSLQFRPASNAGLTVQLDWIRLVNLNSSLCRQVTWSGFAGAVDVYLDADGSTNGNEWLLAPGVTNNTASLGCSGAGSGYSFYAGALAPGSYQVLARPAGGGGFTRSSSAYQVNAIPTLSLTSPSEEGSADDFATNQLGNAWDMNALSDVDQFFNVTNQQLTTISAETPGGTSLGNVPALYGESTQATPPAGDPVLALLWQRGASVRIDPVRYRILTVEFGLPNLPRNVASGSIARIVWRVVGSTDSVSDDIVLDSRAGANVMHKLIVDMADRTVLPIEQGSTIGWVPGSSGTPGLDRFRFDVHEFPNPTAFYLRRVKLAALERVAPGANYTIRWTASEGNGTVTLYRDTDRNPSSGRTLIGSAPTSAGSFVWTANVPVAGYYIYAEIDDGQGNVNTAYSRWPVVVGFGSGGALTTPANLRVIR